MSESISAATREDIAVVILLLNNNVREMREQKQAKLNSPTLTTSELMRNVGEVAALKSVEGLIDMLADLYGIRL